MPYTLAKWALWLIAAAIIGLIIGWMLGRLSAGRSGRTLADGAPDHVDSDDRFLPTDAAGSAGASAGSAAAAVGSAGGSATASPQMPSRAAEVERLRAKVAELESVAIERDRLAWELSELRTRAHTEAAPTAEAVFGPITDGSADAVVALTAERDEWAAKAIAFEQMVSELRVRVWNAEAKAADAQQQLVSAQAAVTAANAGAVIGASSAIRPAVGGAPLRPAPPPRPDLSVGEVVLGVPVRFDDLTMIEGIGPQIAQLCAARGIDSWWALANTDVDRLRRMLNSAGPRFQVHDPASWPEQARLLSVGDWAGFMRLCAALRGGRSVE